MLVNEPASVDEPVSVGVDGVPVSVLEPVSVDDPVSVDESVTVEEPASMEEPVSIGVVELPVCP